MSPKCTRILLRREWPGVAESNGVTSRNLTENSQNLWWATFCTTRSIVVSLSRYLIAYALCDNSEDWVAIVSAVTAKIHYTSFPVTSPQQVRNINDKSATIQICKQVGVRKIRCVCCVALFQQVRNKLATSPSTETCVMHFGLYGEAIFHLVKLSAKKYQPLKYFICTFVVYMVKRIL